MARPILCAWELGGGLGHAAKLKGLAAGLASHGHRTSFAMSAPQAGAMLGLKPLRQAPLWPVQTRAFRPASRQPPLTLGEFLGRIVFSDEDAIVRQIEAWLEVFAASRAEALIADYAPGALLAARGRLPVAVIGNGYTLPPSDLDRFARIWPGDRPLEMSEEEVLARINRALRRTGGEPLDRYPELFSGLAEAVFTLPLFDPYDGKRILPLVGPPGSPGTRRAGARGAALFCYLHETMQLSQWIIDGLAAAGGPGSVYIPAALRRTRKRLAEAGLTLLARPAVMDDVYRDVAVLVHAGGLTMACEAVAAGLPQVIVSTDQEKSLHGKAVERQGIGLHVPIKLRDASALAAAIRRARSDAAMRARALVMAGETASWFDPPATQRAAERIHRTLAAI